MRFASLLAGLGLVVTSGCFEDPPPPQGDTGGSSSGSATTSACDQGSLGCACFPNGTCNFDLMCSLGRCEPLDGGTTTTPSTTSPSTASSTADPTTTSVDTGSSGSDGSDSTTDGGPAHVLFTTSSSFTGAEVGGLGAADATCTALGQGVRRGPWVAILSDVITPVEIRITITGDVVNTQGSLLAVNEPELLSGTLLDIPGYDENGMLVAGTDLVWTGSLTEDCVGWSTDDPMFLGTVGLPSTTDLWLDTEVPLPCSASPRLYCISQ